ncbi:GNAT family N-acetyltransferase [Roseivivax isoporae]|uniref:Acetyltransferase n=1 Tax=Roseivivax isoporae LMG 25204 TaxID=1449351 RepID=X7F688_9RHOB|nr:GNAT family N-acetyltransferase [Roseivivax isoporae]ETX27554.1 acetyltransferase [Roseivivax isoporae LMG 25204]
MSFDHVMRQPVMAGARFDLRIPDEADCAAIAHHAGRSCVARMTSSIPHPFPDGTAEAFVAAARAADRTEDVWVIDGTKSGEGPVLGVISLQYMDRNQSEIGYWIVPEAWGNGIASEAVRTLVEANPLGNRTMFGTVFQDNPASARVLLNCGFDYIGDAESFSAARNATVPTWTYLKQLQHPA